MEIRICRIFLRLMMAALLCLTAATGFAEDGEDAEDKVEVTESSPLIEPHILRLDLNEAEIDTENFEIGIHLGQISVEDFGTNDVLAATFAYHISEDFFIELAGGVAELQPPLEEEFIGGEAVLSNDLDYNYYNVSLGINILPGEVFVWKGWAFNSQVYAIGGVGVTNHYAEEKDTTINFGVGYRLIVWDWLAFRFDFRDHVYKRKPNFGETEEQLVNNLEIRAGASVFF